MPNQNTEAYQLGYRDGINGTTNGNPYKKDSAEKENREYASGFAAGSAVAQRRKMGISPNMR